MIVQLPVLRVERINEKSMALNRDSPPVIGGVAALERICRALLRAADDIDATVRRRVVTDLTQESPMV
jgi:hypothetical protein